MKKILTILALGIFTFSAYAQDVKISGQVFGDFYYNVGRDSAFIASSPKYVANGGMQDMNGFQFRRIDVIANAKLSDNISAVVNIESAGAQNLGTSMGFYVKDAFFKYSNIFANHDLIVGLQTTYGFSTSDGFWGRRYIEKNQLDLRGFESARDMGVTLLGKLSDDFNYNLMIANSSGTGVEADKYKRVYLNLNYSPVKNLKIGAGFDYAANKEIVINGEELSNDATIIKGFVGYGEKGKYGISGEVFLSSKANGMGKDKALGAMGLQFYAGVNLTDDLAVFTRFDMLDPNSDADVKYDARNIIIAGIDWYWDKVTITPNVYVEMYEELASRSIDPSITARLTFHYKFQ